MLYPNNSAGAITAMEDMRLGHYGEDYMEPEPEYCPICGEVAEYAYIYYDGDGDIGCEHCVRKRAAAEDELCPVCGSVTDFIYTDAYGDGVGCDFCMTKRRTDEWM